MTEPSEAMQTEKRSGPITEPCGTPVARCCDLYTSPLQDTLKDLSDRSSHLYLYSAFNNTDCVKALNSIKLEDRVSVMYNNKMKHSIFSLKIFNFHSKAFHYSIQKCHCLAYFSLNSICEIK